MSIILTFKVAQGIVLAADSRLTLLEQGKAVYVSDTHTKLFQLGAQAGILTCGCGFLGGKAASRWVEDFPFSLNPTQDFRTIAEAFLAFLPPADSQSATFVLMGFNPGATDGFDAQIYKLNIFAEGEKYIFDLSDSVSFWDGEFEGLTRLLLGRSPVYTRLLGCDPAAEALVQAADSSAEAHLRIPYYAMSLQEGVDLARFLINLQIQYQRFGAEPQSCGGPIDIAVITPQLGFQWVSRKTLI